MLQADGYGLALSVGDEGIRVCVTATEEACAECLIPKDLMDSMVRDSLEERLPSGYRGPLTVEYPLDGKVTPP